MHMYTRHLRDYIFTTHADSFFTYVRQEGKILVKACAARAALTYAPLTSYKALNQGAQQSSSGSVGKPLGPYKPNTTDASIQRKGYPQKITVASALDKTHSWYMAMHAGNPLTTREAWQACLPPQNSKLDRKQQKHSQGLDHWQCIEHVTHT